MSITAAMAAWLTAQTGVAAFADEYSHRRRTYPCFEVSVAAHETKPQGPCRHPFVDRNEAGTATDFRRRLNEHSMLTIRAICAAIKESSAENECVKLAERARQKMLEVQFGDLVARIGDPDTHASEGVYRWNVGKVGGAQLDDSHEPIVYAAELPLEIWQRNYVQTPVTRFVKKTVNVYRERIHG